MKSHIVVILVIVVVMLLFIRTPDEHQESLRPTKSAKKIENQDLSLPVTEKGEHRDLNEKLILDMKPKSEFGWLFRSHEPYSLFEEDTFNGNLPTDKNFVWFCKMYNLEQTDKSFVHHGCLRRVACCGVASYSLLRCAEWY